MISIVTGVSSGIGLAIASRLLSDGHTVYGISRQHNSSTDSLVSLYPSSFEYNSVDVTSQSDFKSLLRNIWSKHKQLNLIVHSAGIPHGGLLSLTSYEDFVRVFEVNYFAPIFLSQLSSRYLSKSLNPQIIFISSSSSFRYDSGTLAYASSKAALNYSTKQLSFEFSPLNIRVNCIAPGVTDTPMLSEMSNTAIDDQLSSSASSNICKPSYIASMVSYLCSDDASHLNGQILRIDGGMP